MKKSKSGCYYNERNNISDTDEFVIEIKGGTDEEKSERIIKSHRISKMLIILGVLLAIGVLWRFGYITYSLFTTSDFYETYILPAT